VSSPEPIRSIVYKKLSAMRSAVDAYVVQSSVLLYRTRRFFFSRTVIDGNNQTSKLYANKTSVTTIGCSVTTDILTVNNKYLSHNTQVKII